VSDNSRSSSVDAAPAIPAEMTEALAVIERIGGTALLDKITALFRQSANDRMTKLQNAAAGNDLTQVSRLAHAIKGSAAQVGAEPLRAVAALLETQATSLAPAQLRAAINEIARETENAHTQLAHMCAERGDKTA
jgi:HPt (histidine-containing phosphotransfer) domain-containing protein